ncbi:DUF5685 family protein [Kitasatospora sp. NPDC002227]|uniref:DUF5685 family protein n=1 Tax=Kitasatospora sp. NPDC002227 TaxID=3154773 RepID=UPI003322DBB9
MFGIIRPCSHRLTAQLHAAWRAHLCGLCLALRDGHGQLARTATNYDGLVLSVLVEAQADRPAPGAGRRQAGPCPLRAMRGAEVANGEGARLAAAVSLTLASVKLRDHVADGDGAFARRPVAVGAGAVAGRWARQSAGSGAELGFDTGVLLAAAARQEELERAAGPGSSLLAVTEPTETATAAAFAHTAVLAGRPANTPALQETGRLFGRLAHLLDAVEDQAADSRTGAWNPLTATGTSRTEAERLCRDAVHGIQLALQEVEFTDGALAHRLLAHETARAVDRTFRAATRAAATAAATAGATADSSPAAAGGPVDGGPLDATPGDPAGFLTGERPQKQKQKQGGSWCDSGCDPSGCCDCCCDNHHGGAGGGGGCDGCDGCCDGCDGCCDGCDCCCPCDGCN